MIVKISQSFSSLAQYKPLQTWTNKDFLLYFSLKYKQLTNKNFFIPPQGWIGFLSRIKGFRTKLNLDNYSYKNFIDNIFSYFFNQPDYIPSFGAIVSEKVYNCVELLKKKKKEVSCSNEEFEELKNQLYSNLM